MREPIISHALLHIHLADDEWQSYVSMNATPAFAPVKNLSRPLLVLILAVYCLAIAFTFLLLVLDGTSMWLMLVVAAIYAIPPFVFLLAYRRYLRGWFLYLKRRTRKSGEVWVNRQGVCDSAGDLICFGDGCDVKPSMLSTQNGYVLHLKWEWLVDTASPEMPFSYKETGCYFLPIPSRELARARAALTALRRNMAAD